MISQTFWAKLTPDVQKLMTEIWFANVSTYRANAAASQMRARQAMEDAGVRFTDPSPDVLAASRKRMQADVATLVKDARLSPEIVKLAENAANGSA